MPKEEKALATTGEQAVAVHAPASRGFENVDLESVTMPIAKVLQPISKEVADEAYAGYGFRAGMIIHSLLLEKLPDTFVPIILKEDKICFVPKQDAQKNELKQRVRDRFGIELTDDDMKSAFVCRSADNATGSQFGNCTNCGLCEFDGVKAPLCNKNINVLALFEGMDLPVVIRFSSTSHKHGRAFKNLAFFAGGDLFGRKYKLVAEKKTDKGNTWYEIKTQPAGKLDPESDYFKTAEGMYNMFKGRMIEVVEDVETAPAETAATGEF